MAKTLMDKQKIGIEKTLKDVELFALKYPQEIHNILNIIKLSLEIKEEMMIKHLKETGRKKAAPYKKRKRDFLLEVKDRKNRLNDQRSHHINKAIDILTITAEELKDKETFNKKEISNLSKTLREAVGDIFYFIGVAPQAIEECYKMTAKYLKDVSPEERYGYLPML